MGAQTRTNPSISRGESILRPSCQVVEPDARLMCLVRDGDAHAYAVLMHRYQPPLIHFLRRIVRTEHIAEELAQEVFLRVYRSRATYQPTAKFSSWLFRIASHVAINWLRDGKYEKDRHSLEDDGFANTCRRVPDRTSTVEEHLLARVRVREIRNAINSLPANQRAAVFMHKYQELACSQIAFTMNCSEGAVKSLLFRAYERLRSRLTQFSC